LPQIVVYLRPMSDSLSRHFNLAGASNFRDIGGYVGQGGRPVR
jgi:protein-tyrosine phosphatase